MSDVRGTFEVKGNEAVRVDNTPETMPTCLQSKTLKDLVVQCVLPRGHDGSHVCLVQWHD